MKALYFDTHGGPEVYRYGDFPDPEVPPGWVKVRVSACSLNYLDIFSRRGMPGIKVQLPGITGADCVGTIAELGHGVTGWRVGERVLVYPPHIDTDKGTFELMGENRRGALAEYCACRASQLIRVPAGLSDEVAACAPIAYSTAYRMLFTRGQVQRGQSMLVLGASGGVGTAVVQLGKIAGLKVIAAAGSPAKCDRLRQLGADETIDYSATPFDDHIRRTTGSLFRGGGVDVVVNFTGGDTWVPGLRSARRLGKVLTCGATAGFDPRTDLRYVYIGELTVIGSSGFSIEEVERVLGLFADGSMQPPIERVLPLERGAEAVAMLENREVFGKVIVRPA